MLYNKVCFSGREIYLLGTRVPRLTDQLREPCSSLYVWWVPIKNKNHDITVKEQLGWMGSLALCSTSGCGFVPNGPLFPLFFYYFWPGAIGGKVVHKIRNRVPFGMYPVFSALPNFHRSVIHITTQMLLDIVDSKETTDWETFEVQIL